MYSQIDIGISKKGDEETYEYIFNSSNYLCIDFKKSLTMLEYDVYNMTKNDNLQKENIILEKTKYKLQLNINRYIGDEIRFLKNLNNFLYDINIIKYKVDDETYKFIGIEYNNNKYYVYNKKKHIEHYQTINNEIDKLTISEIVIKSFEYYFKHKCKTNNSIDNYYLLESYDNFYRKRYINNSLENPIEYMSLYQSMMLKFEINNENENKSCTFLPVNKRSFSNLFYIYQLIFKILEPNNKIKTFTNPKNESYFGSNYKILPTNYKLKIRLFVSKYDNSYTLYYRKSTEKNNYDINIMLQETTDKIIGFQFYGTKYYIWKNNGDVSTYQTYNETENYIDLILNTFKDALIFLFKIY
jgi:hypothetical protein